VSVIAKVASQNVHFKVFLFVRMIGWSPLVFG
jgi:hypothetical protein